MFTGLIQHVSNIEGLGPLSDGGRKIRLSRPLEFDQPSIGESVAVDGVCLTLTEYAAETLDFFVGEETLHVSNFSLLSVGSKVNLERSLRASDRLGGHWVTGHVDGRGQVAGLRHDGPCLEMALTMPPELFVMVVPKGSLCVQGVSLTVNQIEKESRKVHLYLIPETLQKTNLGRLKVGDDVNIECDTLVKIIRQQLVAMDLKKEI